MVHTEKKHELGAGTETSQETEEVSLDVNSDLSPEIKDLLTFTRESSLHMQEIRGLQDNNIETALFRSTLDLVELHDTMVEESERLVAGINTNEEMTHLEQLHVEERLGNIKERVVDGLVQRYAEIEDSALLEQLETVDSEQAKELKEIVAQRKNALENSSTSELSFKELKEEISVLTNIELLSPGDLANSDLSYTQLDNSELTAEWKEQFSKIKDTITGEEPAEAQTEINLANHRKLLAATAEAVQRDIGELPRDQPVKLNPFSTERAKEFSDQLKSFGEPGTSFGLDLDEATSPLSDLDVSIKEDGSVVISGATQDDGFAYANNGKQADFSIQIHQDGTISSTSESENLNANQLGFIVSQLPNISQ